MGCSWSNESAKTGYWIVGDDLNDELNDEERDILREIWDKCGPGKRAVVMCCSEGMKKMEELDSERGRNRPPRQQRRGERLLRITPQVLHVHKATFDNMCCIVSHARGDNKRQARLLFHVMDSTCTLHLRRDELATALMLVAGKKVDPECVSRFGQIADDIIDYVDDDGDAAIGLSEFMIHQEYIFQMLEWMDMYILRPQDEWDQWRREQKANRYRNSDGDWDKRLKNLEKNRTKEKAKASGLKPSGLKPSGLGTAPPSKTSGLPASSPPKQAVSSAQPVISDVNDPKTDDAQGLKPPKSAWS